MEWLLNKLTKTGTASYTPGTPGVPSIPGQSAQPSYDYWEEETVGGGYYTTSEPPQGYEDVVYGGGYTVSYNGYRYFGSVKGVVVAVTDAGGTIFYTYQMQPTVVRTKVTVPAVPYIAPTPGIPQVPAQESIDYRYGWNSGATGPDVLAVNTGITWRFDEGSIGAAVGLSPIGTPGQTYIEMTLCVIAQSGLYQILLNGVSVTSPRVFDTADKFAITHTPGGIYRVVVNGAVQYETTFTAPKVPDSSLYSAYDVIFDAVEKAIAVIPVLVNVAAVTRSAAVTLVAPKRALKYGPTTGRGIVGAVSPSSAICTRVRAGSTMITAGIAVTKSAGVGIAYRNRAYNPATAVGAVTRTLGGIEISPGIGARADLAFEEMTGSAAGPNHFVGWTGYNGDGYKAYLPELTVDSASGFFVPSTANGEAIMVPMIGYGIGLTGEVSTSCDLAFLPVIGLASGRDATDPVEDGDYGMADVAFDELYVFASDVPLPQGAAMSFSFVINAYGYTEQANAAYLASRNAFSVIGYGSGQLQNSFGFNLEAEATGANIGWMKGRIGYG
jgi:hypothetical protein